MTMMMNMMIMVLINYEIASITGCASFVLACFCFVFVYVPSSLCNIFFSFVLSFSLCCRCFVYTPYSPPPDSKYTTGYQSVLGSHTHIRKINSHSRLLKVKISSGVVLGDCRVGFCNVSCRFTLFSTHSLIAQCRLHHSISPQSVIGGDMNRAVPLQPHRTTRLVLAGPLHIIPLGK